MEDTAAERAALLGEYLDELERERAFSNDLATDLESVSLLLSETLNVVQRQTTRIVSQAEQIRQLMGQLKTGAGWHPPIRLVDDQDVEIPPQMTRASEIRWTAFDGH